MWSKMGCGDGVRASVGDVRTYIYMYSVHTAYTGLELDRCNIEGIIQKEQDDTI